MLENPAPTLEKATEIIGKKSYKFFRILQIAYPENSDRLANLMQRMHDFYNEKQTKTNNRIRTIAKKMINQKINHTNLVTQHIRD